MAVAGPRMLKHRDLLRALVVLMKALAAAYGITIPATNVKTASGEQIKNHTPNWSTKCVERPKSMPQTLKLNGPAPQFHNEINPLSDQTGESC